MGELASSHDVHLRETVGSSLGELLGWHRYSRVRGKRWKSAKILFNSHAHSLPLNILARLLNNKQYFYKPFRKGTHFPVRKRGKFDFDHLFAFSTIFLKSYNFFLGCIFSDLSFPSHRLWENHFQKMCTKRTFSSDFVKLGPKYFIYFWQKNGRLLFFILK